MLIKFWINIQQKLIDLPVGVKHWVGFISFSAETFALRQWIRLSVGEAWAFYNLFRRFTCAARVENHCPEGSMEKRTCGQIWILVRLSPSISMWCWEPHFHLWLSGWTFFWKRREWDLMVSEILSITPQTLGRIKVQVHFNSNILGLFKMFCGERNWRLLENPWDQHWFSWPSHSLHQLLLPIGFPAVSGLNQLNRRQWQHQGCKRCISPHNGPSSPDCFLHQDIYGTLNQGLLRETERPAPGGWQVWRQGTRHRSEVPALASNSTLWEGSESQPRRGLCRLGTQRLRSKMPLSTFLFFFFLNFLGIFFKLIYFNLFIFGCVGSSLLLSGFL